jgi:uncharacterized membrane protein
VDSFDIPVRVIFLFAVPLMPFSTSLMAEFITLRTALLLYWLNIVALGGLLYASWRYAILAGLVAADVSAAIDRSVERRIYVAQGLYAFGTALCFVNTYWSIGFIIVVQLNYVVGPRIRILARI